LQQHSPLEVDMREDAATDDIRGVHRIQVFFGSRGDDARLTLEHDGLRVTTTVEVGGDDAATTTTPSPEPETANLVGGVVERDPDDESYCAALARSAELSGGSS